MSIRPDTFTALTGHLARLGVDLPAEVLTARDVLADAATGQLLRDCALPPHEHLLTLDRADLAAHVRAHAAAAIAQDRLNVSVWAVATDVLNAATDILTDAADQILDQLRPPFNQAAKAVHAATRLGIHPGATPADIITLGPKAITAWQALPAHIATLDDIADARLTMADALNIGPHHQPGAAFSPHAPRWTADRHETATDRWLRLSLAQAEPLRLLTTTQAVDADAGARTIGTPIAPSNADADAAAAYAR